MPSQSEWRKYKQDFVYGTWDKLSEFADAYNLNYQTVRQHAGKDKWVKERDQFLSEVEERNREAVKAQKIFSPDQISQESMSVLTQLLEQHKKISGQYHKFEENAPDSANAREKRREYMKMLRDIESNITKMSGFIEKAFGKGAAAGGVEHTLKVTKMKEWNRRQEKILEKMRDI